VPASHLRLSPCSSDGKPRNLPVKRIASIPVVTQLTFSGGIALPPYAFYEVLDITLTEMEAKREMLINWLGEGILNPVCPPLIF
jgi:hypothetical protein